MMSEDLVVYLDLSPDDEERLEQLTERVGTTYDDVVSRIVRVYLADLVELERRRGAEQGGVS